jgi:uncharacterized protein YdiU (UPF0061 family)
VLDFVGDVSSFLFGTATEADIDSLKKAIKKIETMAETAAADASRTRQGMASVARLQEERYENLRGMLQEEHKSIGAIFRELTKVSGEPQLEVEAITYMTLEMARFVKVHDTIQQLELGTEDLVHGQLTPRLVGAGSLKETLVNISRTLGKWAYELCQKTPKEIYVGGNFDFARKGQDLSPVHHA